jgi:hypothetical protein
VVVETGVLDKKTTDMPQVTDEIDHIQLYRVHVAISEIRTRNFGGVFSKKHLLTTITHSRSIDLMELILIFF